MTNFELPVPLPWKRNRNEKYPVQIQVEMIAYVSFLNPLLFYCLCGEEIVNDKQFWKGLMQRIANAVHGLVNFKSWCGPKQLTIQLNNVDFL